MTTTPPVPAKRTGYHHGNLKEALLQAALGLIAEKGAAGFTFADAARMAGVSAAAPYRHFRDRDELLSSIAQRGFEQFEQTWDERAPLGWNVGDPVPAARACAALLSDWFPATTGEIVHVDGGVHAMGQ